MTRQGYCLTCISNCMALGFRFQKLPEQQKTWGLSSCACLNPQFKVDFKSLLPLTATQLSYFQKPTATHTVDGFPDTQALEDNSSSNSRRPASTSRSVTPDLDLLWGPLTQHPIMLAGAQESLPTPAHQSQTLSPSHTPL